MRNAKSTLPIGVIVWYLLCRHVDLGETLMQTRIQKWGNSLAIRIPSAFAQTVRWKDNTVVEVSLVNGHIVIALARPPNLV